MTGIKARFHQLIADKNWKAIKEEFGRLDVVQLARLIEHLPEDDGAVLFRLWRPDNCHAWPVAT